MSSLTMMIRQAALVLQFLGSSDVQRLNDHLDWRTHKGTAAQAATHFDRPGLDNRPANHSGLDGKANSHFDRNRSAINNSYDTAQYQSRARFAAVGEGTDIAMGDGPLHTADDELDEDETSASHHLTDLRQSMTKMECFNVSNEERVKKFLLGRIGKLHQLSNKKVAKAWIKGICPKKQAHFPYQNKQREEQGYSPEVPGWWPPTPPSRANDFASRSGCASHTDEHDGALGLDCCPFIEPDHVKKHERNILLLHLLRLRPTPEQLKAWNKDTTEPSKTHRFRGWTAFLRELAPVDSLDDVSPTDKKMVHYRRQLFKELYDVAEMEQEWKEFGIDRQFHYAPDPEKKAGRRPTRVAASIASDDDESASTRRASEEAPVLKSVNGPERPSSMEHELPQPAQLLPSSDERMGETHFEDILSLPGTNDVDVAESKSSPQTRRKIEPQWQQWQATAASLNSSFGDAGINDGPVYNGQPPATAPSFFPGSHQSAFAPAPQYHQPSRQHTPTPQQNQLRVYNAMHVPQPHFEPAPYMADFSPTGFAYAQDPQTANPPMPMPNYGLPVGAQNIPSAAAPVPYLPPATQFHEDQSHPMHKWEERDCKPASCPDSADRSFIHFQPMPQPFGEPWRARNQPSQDIFDGAFPVQGPPLQYGGPPTGTIGCF
ncbi:hypothetical protein KC318_g6149 [Hortaea werneckii]|nr:hypothetical protein KC334_g6348 [Hortaea werneckii]KAI7023052.1 hypothetical protein KC355_g1856 [Hortaea werneckii]KAI7667022.1 hypothetical protein KC318_g6149 [Hortaea werneckii]